VLDRETESLALFLASFHRGSCPGRCRLAKSEMPLASHFPKMIEKVWESSASC
jgi:hypothetical protein